MFEIIVTHPTGWVNLEFFAFKSSRWEWFFRIAERRMQEWMNELASVVTEEQGPRWNEDVMIAGNAMDDAFALPKWWADVKSVSVSSCTRLIAHALERELMQDEPDGEWLEDATTLLSWLTRQLHSPESNVMLTVKEMAL